MDIKVRRILNRNVLLITRNDSLLAYVITSDHKTCESVGNMLGFAYSRDTSDNSVKDRMVFATDRVSTILMNEIIDEMEKCGHVIRKMTGDVSWDRDDDTAPDVAPNDNCPPPEYVSYDNDDIDDIDDVD